MIQNVANVSDNPKVSLYNNNPHAIKTTTTTTTTTTTNYKTSQLLLGIWKLYNNNPHEIKWWLTILLGNCKKCSNLSSDFRVLKNPIKFSTSQPTNSIFYFSKDIVMKSYCYWTRYYRTNSTLHPTKFSFPAGII